MLVEREAFVSLFIAAVAILTVVVGFAAFSGLSVYNEVMSLDFEKASFDQGDVFDVYVDLIPSSYLYDESLVVYVDDNLVSVISLKKFFDDNKITYGEDMKNNVHIISIGSKARINLADFVPLDSLTSGHHNLKVYLSQAEMSQTAAFSLD